MQVVILTLEKIELAEVPSRFQKVSVALKFGENTKTIPKPRFVRGKVASFYGEKISVSSTDPRSKNVRIDSFRSCFPCWELGSQRN